MGILSESRLAIVCRLGIIEFGYLSIYGINAGKIFTKHTTVHQINLFCMLMHKLV